VTKLFSRMDVGKVYFDSRELDAGEGIPQRDAGVRVSARLMSTPSAQSIASCSASINPPS
jgi:hypothetical protein